MVHVEHFVITKDDTGKVTDLKEVTRVEGNDAIADLKEEAKKNAEELKLNNELKAKKEAEAKEKQDFITKYSVKNFLIASLYPVLLGQFKDMDFIAKILNEKASVDLANTIKSRLDEDDCKEVNIYFYHM